jgi:hypothetical protein
LSTAAASKPGVSGYQVNRPRGQCVICQKAIEPGQKLMAALRETPEGFERLDVDVECWEKFDRANLLGFWKTTMPQASEKKKVFVDDEVLCGLFERLADATEPAKLNFRFVLGLILMRKRMLVYERSRKENEGEIWSVRFKGREDLLDLLDPRLSEEQVMDVSRQLGEILNEEL